MYLNFPNQKKNTIKCDVIERRTFILLTTDVCHVTSQQGPSREERLLEATPRRVETVTFPSFFSCFCFTLGHDLWTFLAFSQPVLVLDLKRLIAGINVIYYVCIKTVLRLESSQGKMS